MKTVFALFLMVIAIWAFRGKPDTPLKQKETALQNVASVEISRDEINSFLYIWSDYLSQNISPVGRNVSFDNVQPEERLSPAAREWLINQGWKPARFFYVQQRLRTILQTLKNTETVENTIAGLRRQLADIQAARPEGDKNADSAVLSLQKNIQEMISMQEARINIEQISAGELEAVRPYRQVYEAILDGRRTYLGN